MNRAFSRRGSAFRRSQQGLTEAEVEQDARQQDYRRRQEARRQRARLAREAQRRARKRRLVTQRNRLREVVAQHHQALAPLNNQLHACYAQQDRVWDRRDQLESGEYSGAESVDYGTPGFDLAGNAVQFQSAVPFWEQQHQADTIQRDIHHLEATEGRLRTAIYPHAQAIQRAQTQLADIEVQIANNRLPPPGNRANWR